MGQKELEETLVAHSCIFRIWSKWRDIRDGNTVNKYDEVTGFYIQQERRCVRCNMVQLRTEEAR